MTPPDLLRLKVGDLLKRFGAQRTVTVRAHLDGLRVGAASIDPAADIEVDLQLERIAEGVVARGEVQAPWSAPCSRCLAATSGDLAATVDELFEPTPVDGETYLLDGEILDLEPMIRDALVLELPQAPTCRDDCAGLCPQCGVDRNVETCTCAPEFNDPRWAALQTLNLD